MSDRVVDEAILVQRCLGGDESGMRALVDRFQQSVFGLCLKMLSHRQDAEDVVQETFVRTFRSLHRWDPTRPLKPWILTIAANRCRTLLQKRTRQPSPTDFTGFHPEGGHNAESGEIAEEVQRALADLRDEYRECFVLFHQNDLSLADVAAVLGRPEGTVKTWLHRARHELAAQLRRRGFTTGDHDEVRRIRSQATATG